MVTGKATWYASTCRECPAGCGIIARNREGRVVKVEGNPLHPLNRGKLCMRGQAALQAVYNPDRLKTPLLKEKDGFVPIGFDRAPALLKTKAWEAARRGPDRVRLLTEVVGESQMELFRAALKNWNSPPPVVFEPFAYEALKTANREVFGVDGLVSYRLDQADVLLAFGAEFLETWLSPVEYAWKFKAMHAARGPEKGLFFLVSPFQTLTGANADHWLACAPGTEAAGRPGPGAPDAGHPARPAPAAGPARRPCEKATEAYPQEAVLKLSGIPLAPVRATGGAAGRSPPAPGAGRRQRAVGRQRPCHQPGGQPAEPHARPGAQPHRRGQPPPGGDRRPPGRRARPASRRSSGRTADLLILNNVNPVFSLPPESGAEAALETPDLFVVSLSNFLDETSQLADLILPVEPAAGNLGRLQRLVLARLHPPAGHGQDHRRHRTWGTFSWRSVSKRRPAPDYKTYIAERLRQTGPHPRRARVGANAAAGRHFPAGGTDGRLPSENDAGAAAPGARCALPAAAGRHGLYRRRRPCASSTAAGANRPWLCEIPEPISRVAWQSPVWVHPDTARANGFDQADVVRVTTRAGSLEAPAYVTEVVRPGLLVMGIGQGHTSYGRYAQSAGAKPRAEFSPTDSVDLPFLRYVPPESANPFAVLPAAVDPGCGGPSFTAFDARIEKTGRSVKLAKHGRQPHPARPHLHIDHDAGRTPEGPAPGQGRPHHGRFPAHPAAAGGLRAPSGISTRPTTTTTTAGPWWWTSTAASAAAPARPPAMPKTTSASSASCGSPRAGRWPGWRSSATTTNAAWSG